MFTSVPKTNSTGRVLFWKRTSNRIMVNATFVFAVVKMNCSKPVRGVKP